MYVICHTKQWGTLRPGLWWRGGTVTSLIVDTSNLVKTLNILGEYLVMLLIFYTTDISEQHAWELWLWIQLTGLTLPHWGTPVNNPITPKSPVQWGGAHSLCVALQISKQFSPQARTPAHSMSSSNQSLTQNDHSRSFKVTFLVSMKSH